MSKLVSNRLRRELGVTSVIAYGAGKGGDDTAAFSNAAKNAPAAVNIIATESVNIPRAPMCRVRVPAGVYTLTQEVDTGGREVIWELEQAAVISGSQFLNGKAHREGQRSNDSHHGTTDYACGFSIRANSSLEDGAEIVGITDASQLSSYAGRDSVALYVDNTAPVALIDVNSASYTATTVTIIAPTAQILSRYRRGMIVDTKHSPKWSGIVESWNADGSVLTVTGWYRFQGGGTTSTPTNDAGCLVNGFGKVWAINANVFLPANSSAVGVAGFEMGLFNSKPSSSIDIDEPLNRCWGFDAVNLGANAGHAAYVSRGAWRHGYYSNGQETGFAYRSINGAGRPFVVYNNDHQIVFWTKGDGNLEIGATEFAATKYIDFRSSGLNADYDVRIQASGGNSVLGNGNLTILAAQMSIGGDRHAILTSEPVYRIGSVTAASLPRLEFRSSGLNATYDGRISCSQGSATTADGSLLLEAKEIVATGVVRPSTDNTRDLGAAIRRWSTVFAGTGTINTSDARLKTDIADLDEAERRTAQRLKKLVKKYRFTDAVEAKGDKARIHVGVIAQDVKAAFEAEGLDPFAYAVLCWDKWEAQEEVTRSWSDEYDEAGNLVRAAGSEVIEPAREAGDRYGIRYEELFAFIVAAL